MIRKTAEFFAPRLRRRFWPLVYRIKSAVFEDDTVCINNVKIDLNTDRISDSMKYQIRTKNYENSEFNLIRKHIKHDVPVVDLGVGIGYTICGSDRFTDDTTTVVGMEANPNMIPLIERTRVMNSADFDIINAGYHSKKDRIEFNISDDFWTSSITNNVDSKQSQVSLSGISLSELLDDYSITDRVQLVVDIEGGEHDLITNELDVLKEFCELLIIELHTGLGNDMNHYISVLETNGFEVIETQGNVFCLKNTVLTA